MSETSSDAQAVVAAPGRKLAAGGVVASWVRILVTAAAGVLQAPILFRHVPAAELGTWYLFFAVATFVSLSDLGVPSAFGRAASYAWGREQRDGSQGISTPAAYQGLSFGVLYGSALGSTAVLGLAFAATSFPAALLYFAEVTSGAGALASALPLAVFLGGVVLNLIAAIPATGLSAYGDVEWDNGIRSGVALVGLAFVWLVVPEHGSLATLCAIYLGQGAVFLVVSHVVLAARRRLRPGASMRPSWTVVRQLLHESFPIFLARVGAWFTYESTLLIAGRFLGPDRVPDFAILRQIVGLGIGVATAIPVAVGPHVAAAHAGGDAGRVRSMYSAAVRFALVVNVLWNVGLLFWAADVVGALVGPQHFLGWGVLAALAVANLLEIHANSHGHFVFLLGKWPFNPYLYAGGVANVVLASVGAAFGGFVGLAWGSAAAQGATMHWAPVFHGLRQVGVTMGEYARRTISRALLYAAAVAGAAFVVKAAVTRAAAPAAGGAALGFGYILAGVCATTFAAGVIAWVIALTRGDRTYFLRLLGVRR